MRLQRNSTTNLAECLIYNNDIIMVTVTRNVLPLTFCDVDTTHEMRDWAGEMAQQLRALAALLEVLNSITSKHMAAHNPL